MPTLFTNTHSLHILPYSLSSSIRAVHILYCLCSSSISFCHMTSSPLTSCLHLYKHCCSNRARHKMISINNSSQSTCGILHTLSDLSVAIQHGSGSHMHTAIGSVVHWVSSDSASLGEDRARRRGSPRSL